MRRLTLIVATVAIATLGLSILAGAAPPFQDYHADLATLNDSGVTGTATLHLEGDELTVSIDASGLEAGVLHMQHIHGEPPSKGPGTNGNATCPPPSADANADGIVQFGEGLPFYGGVLLELVPYPTPPGDTIDFQATFSIDAAELGPLQNRVIVLHGLTAFGGFDPSIPVACGQIRVTPGV